VKVTRTNLVLLGAVAVLFLMAPTVGDVGGCGSTATSLPEPAFAAARKKEDCKRCTDCKLASERCAAACDAGVPSQVAFPDTCKPLYQDGLVCLHALNAASCDDYARYMDDKAPEVPTECEFCLVTPPPADTVFSDGGAL
jgi:hypothetical protein